MCNAQHISVIGDIPYGAVLNTSVTQRKHLLISSKGSLANTSFTNELGIIGISPMYSKVLTGTSDSFLLDISLETPKEGAPKSLSGADRNTSTHSHGFLLECTALYNLTTSYWFGFFWFFVCFFFYSW